MHVPFKSALKLLIIPCSTLQLQQGHFGNFTGAQLSPNLFPANTASGQLLLAQAASGSKFTTQDLLTEYEHDSTVPLAVVYIGPMALYRELPSLKDPGQALDCDALVSLLREFMSSVPHLTSPIRVRVAIQLMSALAFLHDQGITHADIK